tara:strand:- start:182 stop:544 length:363 start_codon:yes stop_codon:yes gene_type:complete
MCQSIKVLSQVKSGELLFCEDCELFHLVFNNLFFALNTKELENLKSYVDGLEVGYWEHKYACSRMRRKIPLPLTQENLVIMFNRQEVAELRVLLAYKDKNKNEPIEFLSIDDIDYNVMLN